MRCAILLSDHLNTWFNSSAIEGAYQVLAKAGYDVVPVLTGDKASLAGFFESLPNQRNYDGIIVASIALDEHQTEVLKQLTIPVVGLDAQRPQGYDASVGIDTAQGMKQAVSFLQSLGHSHIAFAEQPLPGDFTYCSSRGRVQAFIDAAEELGYDRHHMSVYRTGSVQTGISYSDMTAYIASQILSTQPRPTAVCTETDDFAIALTNHLLTLGLHIPDDLSVIGFDDNPKASLVGLTTLHQDPVLMARLAGGMILDLMQNREPQDSQIVMQTTLISRTSTTPRS